MPLQKPEITSLSVRLLVVAAILAGTAGYLRAAARPEVLPERASLIEFPMTIGPWVGASAPGFDNEVLEILGVDDYITRVYQSTTQGGPRSVGHQLGLYVGYYRSQRQGDTIHSPMNCLPGAGWQPIAMSTIPVQTMAGGRPVDVNRVIIQKGEERQLVLYWYQGRGRVIANEYMSKAFLVWDAGTRNRSDGALVRVISPVLRSESDPAAAEARATTFATDVQALLTRFIPI